MITTPSGFDNFDTNPQHKYLQRECIESLKLMNSILLILLLFLTYKKEKIYHPLQSSFNESTNDIDLFIDSPIRWSVAEVENRLPEMTNRVARLMPAYSLG